MMYSNNIVNFQESTSILNACTKKSGILLKAPRIYIYIYIGIHVPINDGNVVFGNMMDKGKGSL